MRTLIRIFQNTIKFKSQIYQLAKATQKRKYKGSDLGIFWAFAKPAMYAVVFYAAISLGFRHAKHMDGLYVPYFVWLITGIFAWFYMQGMIVGGANCFKRFRPIVRNMGFPTDTIPVVASMTELFIHVPIMIMLLIGLCICGFPPSIYWLQLPLYTALMVLFSIFWCFALGSISSLSKDITNFLSTISQALFWLSGIIFDISNIDYPVRSVFLVNPITFIVTGYRDTICKHIWIWEKPLELLCFMLMMVLMMLVGMFFYSRLRKMLPDII